MSGQSMGTGYNKKLGTSPWYDKDLDLHDKQQHGS